MFTLTDEHHELRAAIRAVTERDIVPQAADCDESERFPQEGLDTLTQSGFNAAHIPEAYGGQGADGVARSTKAPSNSAHRDVARPLVRGTLTL